MICCVFQGSKQGRQAKVECQILEVVDGRCSNFSPWLVVDALERRIVGLDQERQKGDDVQNIFALVNALGPKKSIGNLEGLELLFDVVEQSPDPAKHGDPVVITEEGAPSFGDLLDSVCDKFCLGFRILTAND